MHKKIKEIITLNLLPRFCRSRAFYAKIDARCFYIELKNASEDKRKHRIELKMHKKVNEIITLNLLLVSCRSRAFHAKIDA